MLALSCIRGYPFFTCLKRSKRVSVRLLHCSSSLRHHYRPMHIHGVVSIAVRRRIHSTLRIATASTNAPPYASNITVSTESDVAILNLMRKRSAVQMHGIASRTVGIPSACVSDGILHLGLNEKRLKTFIEVGSSRTIYLLPNPISGNVKVASR